MIMWCTMSMLTSGKNLCIARAPAGTGKGPTHSKFTLAKPESSGSTPWVCFGDINRQWEQRDRGGNAACIANDEVYQLLLLSVGDFEAC